VTVLRVWVEFANGDTIDVTSRTMLEVVHLIARHGGATVLAFSIIQEVV
jgi:hypothetical protein